MSVLLKNLLAFFAGCLAGIIGVALFALPLLEAAIKKDVGLGIVVVAPVVLLLYAVVWGAAGGVAGILVYHIVRWARRKRTKHS